MYISNVDLFQNLCSTFYQGKVSTQIENDSTQCEASTQIENDSTQCEASTQIENDSTQCEAE